MSYESLFEKIENNLKYTSDVSDNCDDDEIVHQNCDCSLNSIGKCCIDKSCINVATQTECIKCKIGCCNQNFISRNYADLFVELTSEKGYGLFSKQAIIKGQFILEFVGELINTKELLRRMDTYDGHLLAMQLKDRTYIDATTKGSISRFLNHSCSPNCRIEVWNVNGSYRVGVFALCDIAPTAELTIDYEWEPSSKPFTKCKCMSKNCRGYIELIDYKQYNQSIDLKPGMWLSAKNIPSIAIIKDEETVKVDPTWLVGKRVKVFWEGNQQYFDSEVIDYIMEKRKHVVKYLSEDTITQEELSMDIITAKWLWFDETRKELVIKKKTKDELLDSEIIEYNEQQHDEVLKENSNLVATNIVASIDHQLIVQIPKIMRTESLSEEIMKTICKNEINMINPNAIAYEFQYDCVAMAMKILSSKFLCQVSLPQITNNINEGDNISVRIYGLIENVTNCIEYIKTCESSIENEKIQKDDLLKNQLMSLQGLLITYDWRVSVPEVDSEIIHQLIAVNGQDKDKVYLLRNKLCMLSDIQDTKLLSFINSNNKGGDNSHILICHKNCENLDLISKRLNHSYTILTLSLCLYLRFFRFCGESAVASHDLNDDLAVVAAIVILALKVRQEFKSKMITKIVTICYSVIFNRTEESCNLLSDSYHFMRVHEKVYYIWNILRNDLYLLDVKSLVLSNYDLIENNIKQIVTVVVPGFISGNKESKRIKLNENINTNDITINNNDTQKCLDLSLATFILIIKHYSWIVESSIHADFLNFSITLFIQVFLSLVFESESTGNLLLNLNSLIKVILNISKSLISMERLFDILDFIVTFFSTIATEELRCLFINSEFILSHVSASQLTNQNILKMLLKVMPFLSDIAAESNKSNLSNTSSASPGLSIAINTSLNQQPLSNYDTQLSVNKNIIDVTNKSRLTRRFPILCDFKTESIIKIPKNMIEKHVSVTKEIFNIYLSNDFMKTSSLSHINITQDIDPIMNNVTCLGLVATSSIKQLQREFKRKSTQEVELKLSTFALSEINILNQLHQLAQNGICSYFIIPFGIFQTDETCDDLFSLQSDNSKNNNNNLYERYYLITKPLYIPITNLFSQIYDNKNKKISNSNSNSNIKLDLDFIIALCHDIFQTLSHSIKCGILFKWVFIDQIFLTTEGSIIFTGLDGAVYMSGKCNDEASIKLSNRTIPQDDIKSIVPSYCLCNTAPEIVMGAKSDHASSLFIFATLCAHLFLSKPFIKPPDSEEKYIQCNPIYIYICIFRHKYFNILILFIFRLLSYSRDS